MAERVVDKSADGKDAADVNFVVSEAESPRLDGDGDGKSREPRQQQQLEYDTATVERIYRKLDLRIIPGSYTHTIPLSLS